MRDFDLIGAYGNRFILQKFAKMDAEINAWGPRD